MAGFLGDIGPCEMWQGDTIDAAAQVGCTFGPVTVQFEETTVTSKLNKTGNAPQGVFVSDTIAKATGVIGQATIAQLGLITGQDPEAGDTELNLVSRVGQNLRDSAQVYILKPIGLGGACSEDETEWVIFPAGIIAAKFNTEYSVEGQKGFAFEITGCPVLDTELVTGGRLADSDFDEGQYIRYGGGAV